MGDVTGIAWTDHTANFSTDRKRMKGVWTDVVKWNEAAKRDGVRRRMFVSSMADIFEDHPQVAPWRAEALDLIASCANLDAQLLTKRPQNIRAMVPPSWLDAWPAHVWIGTTVESQASAAERIHDLLKVPAEVRFLSCEPLLEAVDLSQWIGPCCEIHDAIGRGSCRGPEVVSRDGVEWVIVGGESGPGARRFDMAWARSIVEQCDAARVPVFVKQMGDNCTMGGNMECDRVRLRSHHGADPSEWPRHLQRQEFPR